MSTGVSTRRLPRRKKSRVLPCPKTTRALKPAQNPSCRRELPARGSSNYPCEKGCEERGTGLVRPDRLFASPEPTPDAVQAKTPNLPTTVALPGIRPTPEERELKHKRARLAWLEAEMTRQELRLANLRADVLPFEARYMRKIGMRCARLDEIEAQIAEIEARRHPDDAAAQQAALLARQRAERSRAEVMRHVSQGGFDPPVALKRLYRAVARRVHPDYGDDADDRELRERLMAHANRAYRRCDERRLRGILDEYDFRPEGIRGEGTPMELVRVIRGISLIRGRLEEIAEETLRTRSSELYRFKARAEAAEKQGRDLLAEAASALRARIAAARRELRRLSAEDTADDGAGVVRRSRRTPLHRFAGQGKI